MKQILITANRDGTSSCTAEYLNFDSESLATQVSITFPSDYSAYDKRADIFIGSDKTHDYKTGSGDTLTFYLGAEHLKKGYIRIQPIAESFGDSTTRVKWEAVELKVRTSLNVLESDATVTPSVAETMLANISAFESGFTSAEASRVTAEDGRVLAESGRVSAEGLRLTAEEGRDTAEGLRVSAESSRDSAEQIRITNEQDRVTAEGDASSGRVKAEADRVSAEGARVTAEGLRVTAEQGRVSAESARVTAENARATTLANKADKLFATNLVTNGDFSNGTTGWSGVFGTISALNNEASLTITTANVSVRIQRNAKIDSFVSGNVYYLSFEINTPRNSSVKAYLGDGYTSTIDTTANVYTKISAIKTVTTNSELGFYCNAGSTLQLNDVVKYRRISVVNLTALFGAGKEPTAKWMDDRLASLYPSTSWFNGTAELAPILNIEQETIALKNELVEKTSYGVYTGLGVTQQSTPNMTVNVATGTIYMANGYRWTPTANTALAVSTADATNPRIDIVYVNSSGVIAYLAGTPGATPAQPSTPAGGQLLATILVTAGKTSILTADISDRRKTITAEAWILPTLINSWAINLTTHHSGYYKDSLGNVHIRVSLKSGSAATQALTMPTGYRPSKTCMFTCLGATGVIAYISIDTNGLFTIFGSTVSSGVYSGEIIYRAEA